ncbi:OmpA family protein [Dyella flava]|uniref:OmpA family protein n=1 Tax=Dyella flava TaxID=1920170 RepID=A0ABS2K3S2_9GAMM|nr:OmpA family protein [Dyella flava]MBM7125861.1 OmpA family protein [Dyella flava]GLQ48621.1 membrane protein [Dyella flava]
MSPYRVLGYPYRAQVAFCTLLVMGLALCVLPVDKTMAWIIAGLAASVGLLLMVWRSLRLRRASIQHAAILSALAEATSYLPLRLRTRMPLVLVIGDHLDRIFDRSGSEGALIHVGDGAIWLRVDRLSDLPHLAVAVHQWRDGRAPDGIVLMLSPSAHADVEVLAQALRLARQAASDTSRLLGRRLPGYLSVYQRVTDEKMHSPSWFGISSAWPMRDASRFDVVSQFFDADMGRSNGDRLKAWRAAALSGVIDWTREVALPLLQERRQPAAPWPLYGVAWIDAGATVHGDTSSVWRSFLQVRTRVGAPRCDATAAPWPLPQPLIEAMPQQAWISPRLRALAHALCLLAYAIAIAFWCAAYNNKTLLVQTTDHLSHFASIPAVHDEARRDALSLLVSERDRLDRYQRQGVPMRLDLGLYHGAAVIPALNDAIASYQSPPPLPTIFTLDSMSLFDTGQATLKPGSTRMLVNALEAIKAHPKERILVAGYTDNVGGAATNLQLSVARAMAVRNWLMDVSDVPASRFAIQGYGDTRPIADNDSADGRARNRRVEITLIPDMPSG